MKARLWLVVVDMAALGTRWLDRLYMFAWERAYPPRVSDSDLLVRAVMEDNVPSRATLERLTDE